ncbi:MAG: hypothetical protein ACLRMZ_25970 [Blautia marasmi]
MGFGLSLPRPPIGYYLTRIKYKVVAVVLTVIYAVLAVIVF